ALPGQDLDMGTRALGLEVALAVRPAEAVEHEGALPAGFVAGLVDVRIADVALREQDDQRVRRGRRPRRDLAGERAEILRQRIGMYENDGRALGGIDGMLREDLAARIEQAIAEG